jgi:hypothetical protein
MRRPRPPCARGALRRFAAFPSWRRTPPLGRLDPFGKSSANDRYLREADGWSRREGDIPDRSRERRGWADSAPTRVSSGRTRVRAKAAIPFRAGVGFNGGDRTFLFMLRSRRPAPRDDRDRRAGRPRALVSRPKWPRSRFSKNRRGSHLHRLSTDIRRCGQLSRQQPGECLSVDPSAKPAARVYPPPALKGLRSILMSSPCVRGITDEFHFPR